MLIKIEQNKVQKLMKMPKYKANKIIEQMDKIYDKPKPESLIEAFKMKVRIYYKWKKDKYDFNGNKFPEEKFKDIDMVKGILKMYGITYNPKTDSFVEDIPQPL